MPTKKVRPNAERAKLPPADPAQQDPAQQGQGEAKKGTAGLTGRGADSALVHLKEQEKTRGRKTERS
jgi:hypothetical protein